MAGIGIGLVYLAYAAGLYAYCLFRGYDISVKQLFSRQWPPGGKAVGESVGVPLGGEVA